MKSHKEYGLFILFTGLIVALGRLLFPEENEKDILIFMALVNYIALGFVFLFLHISILCDCKEKINNSGIDTKKKKIKKILLDIFSFIYLLIYLIVGLYYILEFKTGARNDAISIIALVISIASSNLEIFFTNIHYKTINTIILMFEKISYYLHNKK